MTTKGKSMQEIVTRKHPTKEEVDLTLENWHNILEENDRIMADLRAKVK